jgi:excinuclease Cho
VTLGEQVSDLPRAPGVYVFHGDGNLPLYIGKSIDMRSRVQSHLRNPDEARMLAQTTRIETIETAGEIGALLLESYLIKTQNPLYNQRLRRVKKLCSLQLVQKKDGWQTAVVDEQTVAFGQTPQLYGLFSSRHAVRQKLQSLAQQHRLCLQLLGLETVNPRGCFGWQIRQCAGACVGHEARTAHDDRLLQALADMQIHTWPFPGAVHLVERRGDWVQKHRINHWSYQGTWCSQKGAWIERREGFAGFDADSYHIVVKPVLLQTLAIEPVDGDPQHAS